MDIEFLREFQVLSKTCSFQEASEMLYITNSTLSKHIQKMEAELGHSLFERSTRKVALTGAGKILQDKGEQILSLYDEGILQINAESAWETNTLSIAFAGSQFRFGVLDTIFAFKDTHLAINVQLTELDEPPQKSVFTDKQAEFIFAGDLNRMSKEVLRYPFWKEELVLLVSDQNPLAHKTSMELQELAREPLVLPYKDFLQNIFLKACGDAGFTPNIKLCTQSPQTALQLVANNYASAVFPRDCLISHNGGENLHVISLAPVITFEIYMLYLDGRSFSQAGKQFYDYVCREAAFTSESFQKGEPA
ncbi:MAG: LysR family transcriptional regulator [Lachnospiraceae bacterium]|nr:LysR family transcriptional regulator [Lachnospiraceae bacterium]